MLRFRHTKDGEEPEEPLGEVSEVAAVVFAVALAHSFALVGKHLADFSEMLTVTFHHPLSLLGKERFNPLHIGIGGMNCHVQPRRGFLYHAIDVVVDGGENGAFPPTRTVQSIHY